MAESKENPRRRGKGQEDTPGGKPEGEAAPAAGPGDWTGNGGPGEVPSVPEKRAPGVARFTPEEFLAAQREPARGDWSGGESPGQGLGLPRTAPKHRAGPEPDIIDPEFLDKMFATLRFPASLESVICHLVSKSDQQGGRNRVAELHDLIVQLDLGRIRSLDDLKRAVRGRFAWERSHPALR